MLNLDYKLALSLAFTNLVGVKTNHSLLWLLIYIQCIMPSSMKSSHVCCILFMVNIEKALHVYGK